MSDSILDEKREQMIQFLLENILAQHKERIGRDVLAEDRGITYLVKALSWQPDFMYHFEKNPNLIDEDRRELHAITDQLRMDIKAMNAEGVVPAFVLLRTDTDYSQLKDRTTHRVNKQYFLKQKLPSKEGGAMHGNVELDQLELVLQQFHKFNTRSSGKKRRYEGKVYHPELNYFNPKENQIEVVWFHDYGSPELFKRDTCPACHQGNEIGHSECKKKAAYWNYVKSRDSARYSKQMYISRTRGPMVSNRGKESEKGIRLQTVEIDKEKLDLNSLLPINIALVR